MTELARSHVQTLFRLRQHAPFASYCVRTYAVGAPSLRQNGTLFSIVCGFSARSAEKPHTRRFASILLPQAKTWLSDAERRNCVSPKCMLFFHPAGRKNNIQGLNSTGKRKS